MLLTRTNAPATSSTAGGSLAQAPAISVVQQLEALSVEFPGMFTEIRGTGLLFCAEMDPEKYQVVGFGGVEEACREAGIGVIHGGRNALRFTPHFGITDGEIDLVIDSLREILRGFYEA